MRARNITFALLFFPQFAVSAGDPARGKQKAQTCVACHGAEGVSANAFWPNLAAQKEEYLIKQIKAFRDGVRSDPLMSPVSKMISDEDAEDLSVYFSRLKGAP